MFTGLVACYPRRGHIASHVPAGVPSITVGIVPILTFAASAFSGLEKFAVGALPACFWQLWALSCLSGHEATCRSTTADSKFIANIL